MNHKLDDEFNNYLTNLYGRIRVGDLTLPAGSLLRDIDYPRWIKLYAEYLSAHQAQLAPAHELVTPVAAKQFSDFNNHIDSLQQPITIGGVSYNYSAVWRVVDSKAYIRKFYKWLSTKLKSSRAA